MYLVHQHRETVLNVLHCQVLSNRFELAPGVLVVVVRHPLALHTLQGYLLDGWKVTTVRGAGAGLVLTYL